jgi:Ubiquinone biosynthesis protein COQ7
LSKLANTVTVIMTGARADFPREVFMSRPAEVEALAAILRLAYSGELAAALAYRGHWKSVRDPDERARIRQIEEEEWHHRNLVGGLLAQLGADPSPAGERRARAVGRMLGLLCQLVGWLAPMYGAGRLERRNIVEYETAARLAVGAGRPEFVDCLLTMAEVEWDHEQYFRSRVLTHRLAALVPMWPAPSPKGEIRASFAQALKARATADSTLSPIARSHSLAAVADRER